MSENIKITLNSPYKYISFWNGVFNLTKTELQILALLITIEDQKETGNLCSIENKKDVAIALGIKDYNTLNNYIKRLKDKEAIHTTDSIYKLNKLLKADDGGEITVTVFRRY
jgi:DNA-binding CsgD family transcriptional regulator